MTTATTATVTAPAALERYILSARDAGLPRDQLERFLNYGYVSLPVMLPFHKAARDIDAGSGVREIMLDGTRGSAKSHAIVAQVCLDDCQRYDGLKVLFLRKTAKAAGESFDDLVRRVLSGVPHDSNADRIEFANGSRVLVGGYKDDGSIDRYIGVEYDEIVVEEATQVRGDQLDALFGSLRTSRTDVIPRAYLSTNPGGIGHTYCKERYIEPNRAGTETFTRRFFSSYKDNPFIDSGYKSYLESLTGDLARAWRDGDWDVFAGQAFPAWRHDRHVIHAMPDGWESWPHWRAIDWGFAAPFCCLWAVRDPDTGRIIVYRELYMAGLTDRRQARMILDSTPPAERIVVTYADPSMWSSKNQAGIVTSTADEYAAEGVPLTRADNDRLSGKRKVDRLLENLPDGRPGLLVLDSCVNLIRTLPALTYDSTRTEDVDTSQEDHGYDTLRYLLTGAREYKPQIGVRAWRPPLVGVRGL